MKPTAFLFLLFTFLTACQEPASSPSTPSSSVPPFDLTGYETTRVESTETLMAVRRSEQGILEQGMVQNGQRQGSWITFHDNAKRYPKVIANYVAGKLNGYYAEFSQRGQLEVQANYRDGQLHGRYAKYKYTRILESREYKDGTLHGEVKHYFPNSDQVQKLIEYKNGKENGKILFYDEEGNVTLEYVYKDGEKISGGMVD